MIVVQGCSFSYGQSLYNPLKFRYSSILQKFLADPIYNISGNSKDNFAMYFELHAYLLHCLHNKTVQKPKAIIWQTTDTFRYGIVNWKASGSWRPNDIKSLIGNYSHKYRKTILWSEFNRINTEYENMKSRGLIIEAEEFKNNMGMGSKLSWDDKEFLIGDETFKYNELLFGLYVNTIQNLCKQLDIKLVIVNYYGTPEDILNDPIHKNINRDCYLIENSERWGLYNHLCWRGFDRSVDSYHFNVDAHYYQADIIYQFLKHGKKLKVEEEIHDDLEQPPVFDYTNSEEISSPGRRYLLKLSTHKKE